MLDSGGVKLSDAELPMIKLPDADEIFVWTVFVFRASLVGGGGKDGGDCFTFFSAGGLGEITFGESDGDMIVVGGSMIPWDVRGVSIEVWVGGDDSKDTWDGEGVSNVIGNGMYVRGGVIPVK